MLKEIEIPINDDLRALGVRSIIVDHSDMTDNYYLVIDGVLTVRVNIYIKNDYDLPVGIYSVHCQRVTCPIHTFLDVKGFVEDNPVLFKNAIKKLGGL